MALVREILNVFLMAFFIWLIVVKLTFSSGRIITALYKVLKAKGKYYLYDLERINLDIFSFLPVLNFTESSVSEFQSTW